MKKIMKSHMNERFGEQEVYEISPPPPQCLNIELNNTCNQHCIFCPFHSPYLKHKDKPFHMSLDFGKKILEKAMEQGVGRREIGFYATGEPLVYPYLIECVSYAKKLGFQYVFLTSNGALATPDKMESLIDAGLDSIRFSVNAFEKDMYKSIHGADDLEQVVENIQSLANYKKRKGKEISVSISSVITKKTRNNTDGIRKMFADMVDEIVFFPVLDLERLNGDLAREYGIKESKIESYVRRVCPILFNSMYINCHGEVRVCCDARAKNIIAGNLNEKLDLLEIWNNEVMRMYRQMHVSGDINGSVCEGCQLSRRNVEEYYL